ncbi:Major cell-surface adhesin PAc [Mycobacterium shimoidei]|uniref:Major cell-surface adhesin PAc n=1 Tax=Mycobacterium shimoidei TaxID=29313 RepID=A0A375Z1T8_MYCSH|nr:hypothetical protein [Mycobacterium shimoidei]SRX95143.1 Major cell-surface adhesin PAc [Mycobacterium shimoidei]
METVLGLSLTDTAVGWVLVEGREADGAILDHDQFEVTTGGGALAACTSEEVADAVLHARTAAAQLDQRLHLVGVTWSDAASAEAALLLESLTQRGLSNVVPIRSLDSAELLGRGIAPVVGYDRAAVCVLERDSATVVMVDDSDGDAQTAVKHLPGDADRLTQWLTTMFDRSAWKPDGVVVVADDGLDALSWQLEEALPVPVFTQNGVRLAMARGAALAAVHSTEFADAPMTERAGPTRARSGRSRSPSLAGAVGMLAAGAVTLVASVSLAVSPKMLPDKPAQPVHVHKPTPTPIAKAPAAPPAVKVETPPTPAAPEPEPEPVEEPTVAAAVEPQSGIAPEPPADLPEAEPPPPPPPAAPPPPEPNPHPLLTKILERLHGQPEDVPPDAPPPQGPPPNPAIP